MHIPVPVANNQDFPSYTDVAPTGIEVKAVSPPWLPGGEVAASAPGVSTISNAIARASTSTSAEAEHIPSKYLQLSKQTFSSNGFSSITRASESAATTTMSATNEVMVEQALSEAPHTVTTTSAKFRDDDLPAMPEWAVGLLAGLLAFGLVLTVVLYLANFPPTFTWIHKIMQQKMKTRYGYAQLGSKDDSDDRHSRQNGAGASGADADDDAYTTSAALKNSTRRRKSLVVDTSAQYTGLGIALPGDEQAILRKRRRSYDEEAMRLRRLKPKASPVRTAWAALTAPLPSVSLFGHKISPTLTSGPHTPIGGGFTRTAQDLENGVSPGSSSGASVSDYATSPYKRSANDPLYGPETNEEINGLLGMLSSGIEHAAGIFAKAFHDRVENPEEGLLLPVRDCERELALP